MAANEVGLPGLFLSRKEGTDIVVGEKQSGIRRDAHASRAIYQGRVFTSIVNSGTALITRGPNTTPPHPLPYSTLPQLTLPTTSQTSSYR
jgi:hypothetical protein